MPRKYTYPTDAVYLVLRGLGLFAGCFSTSRCMSRRKRIGSILVKTYATWVYKKFRSLELNGKRDGAATPNMVAMEAHSI